MENEREKVSFSARCLRPCAIMGQELIKSAVDASVFVINLTPALISFVMTAALVPLSASRQAGRGSSHDRQLISQWSPANIHHNPSIKSVGDDTGLLRGRQLLYLGCGGRARLRGVALHTNPGTPISTRLGGHFNSLRHYRDLPWKASVKVTADTAVIHKDYFKMSARR